MNIFLRLTLDSSPDAAWRAIADPKVFAAVSAPLLRFRSLDGGFPVAWDGSGPHRVAVYFLGLIPMGTQTIDISFTERPGNVRMMIDSGKPQSGPMRVIRGWDHRMAVSAGGNGRTLYRDRLIVKAGALTPLVWLGLWSFWQWRASKMRRLAKNWN